MTFSRKCLCAVAITLLGVSAVFARSDVNTVPYAENFQNLAPWGGVYTNINITNGWYSSIYDQSVITNLSYTYTATTRPLPNTPTNNVLQLNTEGATLTNSFGAGFDMSSQITYMDTMIQFVASETAPASCTVGDSGIKAAVFADVNTNLAVYHGMVVPAFGQWSSNIIDIIPLSLNASNWYRLTIAFDATALINDNSTMYQIEMFQVRINGVAVQSPYAYDDTWKNTWQSPDAGGNDALPNLSPTGTWFRSATTQSGKTLTGIAFEGTGFIDDLVVTNGAVSFVNPITSYTVMVIIGSHGTAKTNGIALVSGVSFSVPSGASTSIVYTANEWYRIQTLSTNSANVAAAASVKVYTQQLVNITENYSNNVAFYQPPSTNINPSYSNVPTAWLASWGQSESTSLANNAPLDLYQQYLLGVDPYTAQTNDFEVTGIAITNTTVHVSVRLKINSSLWSGINGTLHLYSYTNLTTAGTSVGTTNLTSGAATFQFTDTGSNKFYKASIE